MKITKKYLVDTIAVRTGLQKRQINEVFDEVFETIVDYLEKGQSVTIRGFGTFTAYKTGERVIRNPQTGKLMEIEAKNKVKFKIGKDAKRRIEASPDILETEK